MQGIHQFYDPSKYFPSPLSFECSSLKTVQQYRTAAETGLTAFDKPEDREALLAKKAAECEEYLKDLEIEESSAEDDTVAPANLDGQQEAEVPFEFGPEVIAGDDNVNDELIEQQQEEDSDLEYERIRELHDRIVGRAENTKGSFARTGSCERSSRETSHSVFDFPDRPSGESPEPTTDYSDDDAAWSCLSDTEDYRDSKSQPICNLYDLKRKYSFESGGSSPDNKRQKADYDDDWVFGDTSFLDAQ